MSDISDVLKPDSYKTGLVKNMDRDEYDSIRRLNGSCLAQGLMPGNDIDVRAVRDSYGISRTFTPAKQDQLDCGTLGHMALIQPERIATDVAIWTGKIRSGGAWEEFQTANANKLIVRQSDYQSVMHDVQQLRSRESVAKLIRDVDAEVAVFASEPAIMGTIYEKGLLDIVSLNKQEIVDVKFTEAGISEYKIHKTMRDLFYREKMAHYRRLVAKATGTKPSEWKCKNLFLSRSGSLGVHVVEYTTMALEWAEKRMMNVMLKVAECLSTGDWPMLEINSFAEIAPFEMEKGDDITFDGEIV